MILWCLLWNDLQTDGRHKQRWYLVLYSGSNCPVRKEEEEEEVEEEEESRV
jgi:hypothetical protein